MPSGFAYKLVKKWSAAQTAQDLFHGEFARLKPHQSGLLLSDGSLTLELERMADDKVRAEVVYSGTGPVGAQDAAYLDVEASCLALKRTVWLIASGERLVYAHTVIPLKNVDAGILDAIEKRREEPLGRVLGERGVFFTKDKLEIATMECADAASGFGLRGDYPLPEDSRLFSRRYILTDTSESAGLIKAAVIEVFSPALVPCGINP